MRSIVGMKAVAKLITEETQEGHNTAARVGGLFEDIVDYLDSADPTSSLKIDRYVTTGTRIAKFTVGGEETIIYAPSNGGSGGGGGGSSSDGSEIPEIQAAIEALDDALDSTTKLAKDEKARLDDLVKGIGEDISGRMKDALEYAEWIRGNHPEGEVFFESGWNDKAKEFMQTVGLWDTDEATTRTRWSYYKQNYNTIAAAVSAINKDGNFSTFLQGLIEDTITDESVQTSISNTYAKKDDTADIINWMYSALKGSASEYETFNDLVSAASNGTSSAISEVRTYVNVVKNGEVLNYVANTNMATKVDNALTELYQTATPGYSSTSIFSQVKQDSTDIAALVQKITNNTSSTTVANKIAQWQAGFVTQATLEGAFASMLATDSDHSTVSAIVTSVNDAGSNVTISANHIEFTGQTIDAITKGLHISNGQPAGYGQYSFGIDIDNQGGIVLDSRGQNAHISKFVISGLGNFKHTFDDVETFAFNREGDGFLAKGHLAWTATGDVSINSTGEFEDELGTNHTVESIAHFTTNGFEIENNDDADSDFYNIFRIYRNGSILQQVNLEDVFKSNYDGTGFIGISSNANYNKHAINWTEKTAQLFDILTVSKYVAALGEDTVSVNGALRVGNYRFGVDSSKLNINTVNNTSGGIQMDATGTLAVDGYEAFSLPDNTNLDGFLFHSGSLTAYTIKNGLIVRIPS